MTAGAQALVQFHHLGFRVKTKKGKKVQLIKDLSGFCRPGSLTAILVSAHVPCSTKTNPPDPSTEIPFQQDAGPYYRLRCFVQAGPLRRREDYSGTTHLPLSLGSELLPLPLLCTVCMHVQPAFHCWASARQCRAMPQGSA
jgi:hypothetical protein